MNKPVSKVLPIAQIKPSEENIRVITKGAIKAVKQSIERYGYNVPIIVDLGGNIIAGHTRYQALKHMNVGEVTCIVLQETDPKILDEIRLLDNHIGEQSDWDMEKLGLELRHIFTGADAEAWSELKLMFPDTGLLDRALSTTLGKSVTKVTKKQVDAKQNELDNKFKNRKQSEVICMNCPNCNREITVKDNL